LEKHFHKLEEIIQTTQQQTTQQQTTQQQIKQSNIEVMIGVLFLE